MKKIDVIQHTSFLMEFVEGYRNGPEAFEHIATQIGSLGLGYEAVLYAFY